MTNHYQRIVALASDAAERYLANQDTDPGSRYYGGIVSPEHGYAEPGGSGSTAATLMGFYLCPDHPRAGDPRLLKGAELLLDYLLREQHDDGTLDLLTTNFHDATMVGFVMQNLGYTYKLLSASLSSHSEIAGVLERIQTFVDRGAEGMRNGGFHTPNHRWVLASGLSLAFGITGDARYREEAQRYLAEGIDCTAEGEYTERSVGVYNVVNNRSLIIVAQELDRPDLLDHVVRNLRMVPNYIEPDGSLFTMNSRRQDQGQRPYPATYYENYLLMAYLRRDRQFAGIADTILSEIEAGRGGPGYAWGTLTHFLLDDELRSQESLSGADDNDLTESSRVGYPSDYRFFSDGSQIARSRSGLVSTSVLGRHESFLRFQVGEAVVSVRVHGTFYGDRGRFSPDGIERDGEDFVLRYASRWGYVRPFPVPPETSVWDEMPHGERERVHMDDYRITVRITPSDDSVTFTVRFDGLAGVLTRVEMIFGAGGVLDTDGLRVPAAAGGWAVLRAEEAVYALGPDRIRVVGGRADHGFASDMRGGQPPVADGFTLFTTGVTPSEQTLTFRAEGRAEYRALPD